MILLPSRRQVRVTYDDEPGPQGFERVSRDLVKGGDSGRRAYLWLRRQSLAASGNPRPDSRQTNDTPSSSTTPGAPSGVTTTTAAAPARDALVEAVMSESPGTSAGSETPLVPLGEVVIAFGEESDPNVAEAAEQAAAALAAGEQDGETAPAEAACLPWERLNRSLNPGARAGEAGAVFLWYRRGSDDDTEHWSAQSLVVSRGGD